MQSSQPVKPRSWLPRPHNHVYWYRGRGGARGWRKGLELFGRLWGFDRSLVYVGDEPYLDRWILYINGWTLRLHKFYRGDDDRAWHSHPWWFITFPLAPYWELVMIKEWYSDLSASRYRKVRAWRPHFRRADFVHYVEGGDTDKPFYTIVITGAKRKDDWGFWPIDGSGFVPHQLWQ